jgi:hypothetical protein
MGSAVIISAERCTRNRLADEQFGDWIGAKQGETHRLLGGGLRGWDSHLIGLGLLVLSSRHIEAAS